MVEEKEQKRVVSYWIRPSIVKRLKLFVVKKQNKGLAVSISSAVEQALESFLDNEKATKTV